MQTTATKMPRSHPPTERSVGRKRTRPTGKATTLRQRFTLRLHDLVEATDLSNQDIAKKLKVSQEAVGKWFRGEALPDIDLWESLAKLLGCDPTDFISSR